jgi:hypothetical protein
VLEGDCNWIGGGIALPAAHGSPAAAPPAAVILRPAVLRLAADGFPAPEVF